MRHYLAFAQKNSFDCLTKKIIIIIEVQRTTIDLCSSLKLRRYIIIPRTWQWTDWKIKSCFVCVCIHVPLTVCVWETRTRDWRQKEYSFCGWQLQWLLRVYVCIVCTCLRVSVCVCVYNITHFKLKWYNYSSSSSSSYPKNVFLFVKN